MGHLLLVIVTADVAGGGGAAAAGRRGGLCVRALPGWMWSEVSVHLFVCGGWCFTW